jgi:hypothetical protein
MLAFDRLLLCDGRRQMAAGHDRHPAQREGESQNA